MSSLLRRGALAGAAGGMALALFLLAVGEGPVGDAVALESARAGGDQVETFSRAEQQIGGALGAVLYGLALGVVFAVVFAALRHRIGGGDDWRRANRLAGGAFVVVHLVPFLKYPGNPPAVGRADSIGARTGLYLLLLAWSVVAAWGGWRLHRWLGRRGVADHLRGPGAVAGWAALIAVAYIALPANPDPVDVPATLLWRFRVASLGGSLMLWSVIGTAFGWLTLRARSDSLLRAAPRA